MARFRTLATTPTVLPTQARLRHSDAAGATITLSPDSTFDYPAAGDSHRFCTALQVSDSAPISLAATSLTETHTIFDPWQLEARSSCLTVLEHMEDPIALATSQLHEEITLSADTSNKVSALRLDQPSKSGHAHNETPTDNSEPNPLALTLLHNDCARLPIC